MSLFDIVDDLLFHKVGRFDESYKCFIINRALSMHSGVVFYVNEMNIRPWLSPVMQHDYLFYSLPKGQQSRAPWHKNTREEDEAFAAVQEYFVYNNEKTREALRALTSEQTEAIKQSVSKGGVDG